MALSGFSLMWLRASLVMIGIDGAHDYHHTLPTISNGVNMIRPVMRCALLVLAVFQGGAPAIAAEPYPSKPIRLIVPFPPGAMTDYVGRLVGEALTKTLNASVVVENRPGASGLIGSDFVRTASPDGYTLGIMTTDATVRMLQRGGSDPVSEFTHVSMLASQPMMLIVNAKSRFQTLNDYVQDAKKNPDSVTYGSNGDGSATHLAMKDFSNRAGIKLVHIPYKGALPALTDVLGGQVDSMPISFQAGGAQLRDGGIRALAVSANARLSGAPTVPTFAEAGYPSFEFRLWYGLVAPKGLPDTLRVQLRDAVQKAFSTPDMNARVTSQAADSIAIPAVDPQAFMQAEVKRWSTLLESAR